MHDYLDRFRAMAAELARHPRVRVSHLWVGAGATDAAIAEVESRLGRPLPAPIRALYRQADGLQLRWMDTANPRYVSRRDDAFSAARESYLCGDNGEADGLVDLLPLDQVFRAETLAEHGSEPELYLLDQFSFYSGAALSWSAHAGAPQVVFGDDHNATFTDSNLTDFTSYLEFVLQRRGHVQGRSDTFFSREKTTVVIERGPPVAIETLLSDRATVDHDDAVGKRVSFRCTAFSDVVRGTVTALQVAPTLPRSWPYDDELCRVRLDLGVEVWVARSNATRITEPDAYERAIADAAGFFARLLVEEPAARFQTLATIGARHRARVGDVASALGVRTGARRFEACVLSLPPRDGLAILLALIDGFLQDKAEYETRRTLPSARFDPSDTRTTDPVFYADIVRQLLSAAALRIGRAFADEGCTSLASHFGPQNSARLAATLDHYAALNPNPLRPLPTPDPKASTEFLRRALSADPGKIVAPFTSRGVEFGVEDLPVVW